MHDRGPIFAALDYGTGSGKCALFDAAGHCLAVAREPWTYREEPVEPPGFTRGYSFDPDAFWHLHTGRVVAATRSVPSVDSFSHPAAGRRWDFVDWLADLILYASHRLLVAI